MSNFPAWKSSKLWVCGYPIINKINLPLLMITTSYMNNICSIATSSNCRNFRHLYVRNYKSKFIMNCNIHVSRKTVQPSLQKEDAVQRLNVDGFIDCISINLRYSLVSMRKDRVGDVESPSGNGWISIFKLIFLSTFYIIYNRVFIYIIVIFNQNFLILIQFYGKIYQM